MYDSWGSFLRRMSIEVEWPTVDSDTGIGEPEDDESGDDGPEDHRVQQFLPIGRNR